MAHHYYMLWLFAAVERLLHCMMPDQNAVLQDNFVVYQVTAWSNVTVSAYVAVLRCRGNQCAAAAVASLQSGKKQLVFRP